MVGTLSHSPRQVAQVPTIKAAVRGPRLVPAPRARVRLGRWHAPCGCTDAMSALLAFPVLGCQLTMNGQLDDCCELLVQKCLGDERWAIGLDIDPDPIARDGPLLVVALPVEAIRLLQELEALAGRNAAHEHRARLQQDARRLRAYTAASVTARCAFAGAPAIAPAAAAARTVAVRAARCPDGGLDGWG